MFQQVLNSFSPTMHHCCETLSNRVGGLIKEVCSVWPCLLKQKLEEFKGLRWSEKLLFLLPVLGSPFLLILAILHMPKLLTSTFLRPLLIKHHCKQQKDWESATAAAAAADAEAPDRQRKNLEKEYETAKLWLQLNCGFNLCVEGRSCPI